MTCVATKPLPRPSPCPAPQQEDGLEVFESSENDAGGAADIRDFIATSHKRTDIWFGRDKVQDLQQSLCHVDPSHSAELEASLCQLGVDFSRGLISVTPVQPALNCRTRSTFWIATKNGKWCCSITPMSKSWTSVTTLTC